MKFIVLSHTQPHADEATLAPHLVAEAAQSWRHYLDGFIREAYFRTAPSTPGAVLVVEANDLLEARRLLEAMPLRREGLVDFEVIPVGPFLPWTTLMATS